MTTVFDCTLRDSSYVVDFMLDLDTTRSITKGLAELGVSHIEVGHGLGLGGARLHGKAAGASDAAYLEAALSNAGSSKVGCFLIAGNATLEEVRQCVQDGAQFIRVGISDTAVDAGVEVVEDLQGRGVEIFPFLMATSIWPLAEIETALQRLKAFETAGCYYVDSAGCLYGGRTAAALNHFSRNWSGTRGFHGHNNLQSAISNCLEAADQGYAFVDGTLGGFGRSGGNAPTEILLSLLTLDDPDRISRVISLAEEFSQRVGQAYDYWDVALGLTGTHSRHLGKLLASGRSRDEIFRDLYLERARTLPTEFAAAG
jgi:4-hydroxy 2-oxovalerate aldolase